MDWWRILIGIWLNNPNDPPAGAPDYRSNFLIFASCPGLRTVSSLMPVEASCKIHTTEVLLD
jgi:hypothetical protein